MLNLAPPKNQNYCATVVELKHFVPLAGCDNVQGALIFGNQVIVGKDAQPGDIGLYFPVEVALSREFLAANNLYRKPEWGNVDPAKKGFFEESGRVKCVKFRGNRSEGFYIPIESVTQFLPDEDIDLGAFEVGQEFDELAGHLVCHKYVPARTAPVSCNALDRRKVARSGLNRPLAGQFAYHIDTAKLDRNIHKLQPSDIISITEKWHGTSAIFAHVLVERPLKWYERCLAALGIRIEKTGYEHVWASRRVIKGVGGQPRSGVVHYYKSDIWGEVFKEVKDLIPKGYTLYGEIVGFNPTNGGAIQEGYSYGCVPTKDRGKVPQYRFVVYRVTYTNPDGKVLNLSWPQIREFCAARGLETVKHLYYGYVTDLFIDQAWGDQEAAQLEFLRRLKNLYVEDKPCPHNPGMPAEGVVLRIERGSEFEAYKCKSFAFLQLETKQLDKGTVDIETIEGENVL